MIELTPRNYRREVELSREPVLICVHDTGAMPPAELEGLCKPRLKCCALDAGRYEEMAKSLRILGLPTAIVLEGGRITQRIRGERSVRELARILDLD
ncbi:MAG: thioredoxin family protein [Oscillospiraceae bacterium]|jgi:LmbE family N-acetylglucosaminyl deacetylase|nr:thioredoxin family protein [Oscillospiraceae bacterium]